jgi:hypothetical protein
MLKSYKRSPIKPIQQITENHCGPAVLQMLLENMEVIVDQKLITHAAGAEKTINDLGTRVDQLARATQALAPGLSFWYKEHATLNDLRTVINEYFCPVGVEWQGLFEDRPEDDALDEGDYGHYSIITKIDDEKSEMIIIDPYKDYVKQARIVPIDVFLPRWWDWNELVDPQTNKSITKKDENLFFIVTGNEIFPDSLGMQKFTF